MKILITILLVILGIIVLLLVLALFTKKDYSIEREIVIFKPRQQVFDYIKFLKNQDNYSKWAMMDPAMKKSYRGTDGTAGFVSSWDSDKKDVGKGEQEIKKITDGERVDFEIRFIKPFEARANAYMTTVLVSDNQTRVTWGFESKMKYPMNLMLIFMNMERAVGNDLSTGLANLKQLLEKQ
jgi:hypothetical protein